MPTTNQILMRQAKQMLAGNWGNAALGTLIYLVIMGIVSCSCVGELLLFGPFTLGYIVFLIGLYNRQTANYEKLFNGFSNFVQTFLAGLLFLVAVSIGCFFLVIPGIIVALGFGMTFFIMTDHPTMEGVTALKTSWKIMRGHKWDLFCLNLRFVGWWIVCLLTLGVGFLWLYPYMLTANMNFYRNLSHKA